MNITQSLNQIISDAFDEVVNRQHEFITLEHIFLSMLKNSNITKMLTTLGADVEYLTLMTDRYLNDYIEKVKLPPNYEPLETQALQRVTNRVFEHIQGIRKHVADEFDFLVAMLDENDSFFIKLLERFNIQKPDILEYITSIKRTKSHSKQIDKYTIEMVSQADKYDEVIKRDTEIERIIQILSRRKKNNPILVGEAGVGKSAIVEGLAKRIASSNVPPSLQNKKIFALDIGSLVAGTKYRGEFEKRMKEVLAELKKYDQPIVFIDEIHMIVGAGSSSNGSIDVANLLKPALARGEIRCIGATTYEEYKQTFLKDKALNRRFQKVDINEPSVEDTIKILQKLKPKYEQFHNVKYSNEALITAATLSKKYLREKYLPDSAIDVLDEVGAKFKINNKSRITKLDIEDIVANMANIPRESAKLQEIEKLRYLEDNLKKQVFNQDHAIKEIVKVIKRKKAGLTRDDKPIGSFLFVGPTGVGKTEIAKQLANILGIYFLRFDMSEYQEAHSVAKLIGAPPGYVGYEKGGLLTESIQKHPHCVLLLDEIEKAHEDIVQILLQVMDNATLRDNDGRSADFRNVILIMTSNLGVNESGNIGFNQTQGFKEEAIKRFFAPEFLNRLDATIRFEPLNKEGLLKVVDKFLSHTIQKLEQRNIKLTVSQKAKEQLIQLGYDIKMGARPMARVIENEIIEPLSDEILFGKLKKGGEVVVDFCHQFTFRVL
ncbi:MAG: AAA domain-containing protein [Epsilonproteobacteria bacterium]|nr:AAA domain-containing protein [Campylobacterota bacterium]